LTANALKGEAEHCRAVGMDDYRSKPCPLAELKSVLDKWLPATPSGADGTSSSVSPSTNQRAVPTSPVDVSVLKELVGDDPDVVREFLHDFRLSAAKITMELRAAYDAHETKAVVEAAHKLKSAALSVGASALGELCGAMEDKGKAGDMDTLTVLLPRFETEIAAVENYLEKLH
ncbi:MAG TPA: Hpt domain-containing protein, partial [Burkholderiales bacterium]|nr:Hpt domain-containing protein [Burkholderiales bacterium]